MQKILAITSFLTTFFLLNLVYSEQVYAVRIAECGSNWIWGNCTNSDIPIDCGGLGDGTGNGCCADWGSVYGLIGTCNDVCAVSQTGPVCSRDAFNGCLGATCGGMQAFCCNYSAPPTPTPNF